MNNLKRFVVAQNGPTGYATALQEMKNGQKVSHWMWYIFPQIKGLGRSSYAQLYAIDSLFEAREYIKNNPLGKRLREITKEVNHHWNRSIETIMGSQIDAMKFHSCMTLFDVVCPGDYFADALDTFFGGVRDQATLAIIAQEQKFFYGPWPFKDQEFSGSDEKALLEIGTYESEQIPDEVRLATLVDLYLRGKRMKDVLHHYLYHMDFRDDRLSGIRRSFWIYGMQVLEAAQKRVNDPTAAALEQQLAGWEDKFVDADSAADDFEWMLDVIKANAPAELADIAKDSPIK